MAKQNAIDLLDKARAELAAAIANQDTQLITDQVAHVAAAIQHVIAALENGR